MAVKSRPAQSVISRCNQTFSYDGIHADLSLHPATHVQCPRKHKGAQSFKFNKLHTQGMQYFRGKKETLSAHCFKMSMLYDCVTVWCILFWMYIEAPFAFHARYMRKFMIHCTDSDSVSVVWVHSKKKNVWMQSRGKSRWVEIVKFLKLSSSWHFPQNCQDYFFKFSSKKSSS